MRALFTNEVPTDFSQPEARQAMEDALRSVESQLGRRGPLVIGSERRTTDAWIQSVNPGNPTQIVGEVAKATKQDAIDALIRAGEAFPAWSRTTAEARAGLAFRLAGIYRQRKLEFAAWMVYELDKAWDEADGEVCEAIDMLEWNGREVLRLAQPAALAHLPNEANRLTYQGLGVGVVIPPWNFPCAIFTNMVMAAVVAGNTVVVKPATNTPVIASLLVDAMMDAGVPAGVVNLVPGSGGEIGDLLVDHPSTRFIAFTGSKEIGIRIFERGAKVHPGQRWLKRVTAEMGGKDAIIVADDADVQAAADAIVVSAFGFSGQKCSACSLAVVDDAVYDDVVERVAEATARLRVGSARDGQADVGAVVDASQYQSILDYIDIGNQEGRLVTGGHAVPDTDGYYIQPTVFADVDRSARIATEEIFGPVLAIVRSPSFETSVEIVNDLEYGLTGSVFSRDRTRLEWAGRELEVGNIYFNRKCTGAMMGVHPFGGMKMSGTNTKSGGPDYLVNFMEAKAIGERLDGPTS